MGEEEEGEQVVVGERGEVDKGMHVEKELGLTNLEGLERLNEIEKDVEETTAIAPTLADNCDKSEEDTKPVMEKAKHLAARHVAPPKGMDPTKPRQEKAKLARREKWEKKVKEGKVDLKKKEQQEKTVEELLDLTNTPNPAHTFTKRLVKADEADPDFISSFSESLLVYQKYQMSVHGDKVDKCTDKQFRRFLCSSPLQAEAGLGSFHMQYLIDGRIVAVGVIDILPRCVSSGKVVVF